MLLEVYSISSQISLAPPPVEALELVLVAELAVAEPAIALELIEPELIEPEDVAAPPVDPVEPADAPPVPDVALEPAPAPLATAIDAEPVPVEPPDEAAKSSLPSSSDRSPPAAQAASKPHNNRPSLIALSYVARRRIYLALHDARIQLTVLLCCSQMSTSSPDDAAA